MQLSCRRNSIYEVHLFLHRIKISGTYSVCPSLHPQYTLDIELRLTCSDAHTERQGPELSSTRVQRLEPGRADYVFPDDRRLCVLRPVLPLSVPALGAHTLANCSAAGDQPNSKSDGKPAGHNTDGFDVSTTDLVIENR